MEGSISLLSDSCFVLEVPRSSNIVAYDARTHNTNTTTHQFLEDTGYDTWRIGIKCIITYIYYIIIENAI